VLFKSYFFCVGACCFGVFMQNSEQFKILLIDGPLIGPATAEVSQMLANR